MSRFRKLTHAIWHCLYHIVWTPKYRFRVLQGPVRQEVYNCIQLFLSRKGCEAVELNVQPDHVHLVVFVPPKVSISDLMGIVLGWGLPGIWAGTLLDNGFRWIFLCYRYHAYMTLKG